MDKLSINELSRLITEIINEIDSDSSVANISAIKNRIKLKVESLDKLLSKTNNELNENYVRIENELNELAQIRAGLEQNQSAISDLIENTHDRIWSLDSNLNIVTFNSNFKNDYKTAFGIELIKGVNIITSLPEPIKSVWQQRYGKVLNGERFTAVDRFDFRDIPQYIETSFHPIYTKTKITGISCFARDISKHKESEDKFKRLSEMSPGAISIQANNEFLYANKAWERLTGYSGNALKTKPFLSIFDDESKKIIELQLLKNKFNNNEARRGNVQIITKKNTKRWIDISIIDLKYEGLHASMVVASDITEFYNLQEELKKNRANLVSQIENTDARIWSIDKAYRIITANKNFTSDYHTAFGVLLEEGSYSMANLSPEMEKTWMQRYNRALKGENFTLIDEFKIENIPQFAETSFNPIYVDKTILGVSCYSRDITNQRRYEMALEESENKFKTLVSNLPGIVYRCANDPQLTMEYISDEVEHITGYPASDFINNKIRSFASIIHPGDNTTIEEEINKCITHKQKYEFTYRLIHSDNSIRWVHEVGRAHYNKNAQVEWLDGVIIDITEQKKFEEALIESEEKYRNIFNRISDIFVRTDLNGTILIASPSVYDNFGYKPEEIIGQSITRLYVDPGTRENFLKKLLEKENLKDFELRLKSKEGKIRTVSLSARLIKNESGIPVGIESLARDITLRKIAEQMFHNRTKELNSIFDNAPMVLILIDSNGQILNINRAGTNLTDKYKKGYFEKLLVEILNCIKSINIPEGCGKGEKCNRCIVRKTLKSTLNTKQNQYQVEGTLKLKIEKEEKTAHFLLSTTYIDFENDIRVLLSFDDITEMKDAQEQIRKLSTALNQSTATILITDLDGSIQYVNPQFEKTTGYTFNEVLGKNPRFLKSDKTSPEEYKVLWDTILKGETWQGEFLNVRKDKTEYWENAIISPIYDETGEINSFIAVKENITERKRIQQELMRSEKELRQMNDEKSRFFSILAHDLRGMVGSYHAYSDLLITHFNTFSNDELKEQLKSLAKSSSDSLVLLDNLLEWARASLGKTALSLTDLNLAGEVDAVLGILNDIAASKQIKLMNHLKPDLFVFADSNVLRTIIRNLVSNAIKFTDYNGSITIVAREKSSCKIEISVTDTGIGMDKTTISRLFKPGEKVIQEGTNHETGTGLGLMICDEMVKKLGGVIAVESQPGKGSRFYFTIPQKK